MDWSFIQQYAPMYVQAAGLTLRIGLYGIGLSLLLGLFCAVVQFRQVPVLRRIISVYIELSRNTPLLVQLFFLYFGLPKLGVRISAEGCAVIGLTFLGGSYMAEAFRSGLESVENVQRESALSLGLTEAQTMGYIVLPQALVLSVPPLCANVIFLIKETSVFSAILVFTLWGTAELGDLVRGALQSIPRHQYDSAGALGMTKLQTYRGH